MVIKALVQSPRSIEGLVFATHYLAAEGLRKLKSMKIQVPDDVAIVSYGQKRDYDLFEPTVTSVRLPTNEMGDKAVDILLYNMKETTSTYEKVRLQTELVVRRSCGAL
jgi:LacI family transcriptional regulator